MAMLRIVDAPIADLYLSSAYHWVETKLSDYEYNYLVEFGAIFLAFVYKSYYRYYLFVISPI